MPDGFSSVLYPYCTLIYKKCKSAFEFIGKELVTKLSRKSNVHVSRVDFTEGCRATCHSERRLSRNGRAACQVGHRVTATLDRRECPPHLHTRLDSVLAQVGTAQRCDRRGRFQTCPDPPRKEVLQRGSVKRGPVSLPEYDYAQTQSLMASAMSPVWGRQASSSEAL